MPYAHLRPRDVNQLRVLGEMYAGYALEHRPPFAEVFTRQALLTLGWESAEAREGARLAEVEATAERHPVADVAIIPEHLGKL